MSLMKRMLGGGRSESVAGWHEMRGKGGIAHMVVTGVEELDKLFMALPESMQKKALRPAARTVAKMVLVQAKAEVPEDTGRLLSELRVKAKKRTRRHPYTVGVTVGFADDLFKGDTFYAGFMEFGTRKRYHKLKNNKTRIQKLKNAVLMRKGKYVGEIDETRYSFLRPALWSYPERKQAVFRQALTTWLSSRKEAVQASVKTETS